MGCIHAKFTSMHCSTMKSNSYIVILVCGVLHSNIKDQLGILFIQHISCSIVDDQGSDRIMGSNLCIPFLMISGFRIKSLIACLYPFLRWKHVWVQCYYIQESTYQSTSTKLSLNFIRCLMSSLMFTHLGGGLLQMLIQITTFHHCNVQFSMHYITYVQEDLISDASIILKALLHVYIHDSFIVVHLKYNKLILIIVVQPQHQLIYYKCCNSDPILQFHKFGVVVQNLWT